MPKLGEDAETRLTVAALAAAIVRGAECEVPGLSRRVVSNSTCCNTKCDIGIASQLALSKRCVWQES